MFFEADRTFCRIEWALGRLTFLVLFPLAAASARAQEPINAFDSATQPSPGSWIVKQQFRYVRLDDEPTPAGREVHEFSRLTAINYGLAPDWSLSLRLPMVSQWRKSDVRRGHDEDFGLRDITFLAKWRPVHKDSGPIDTLRFAVLGGIELRSGDLEFSSDSYDPIIGCALTQVKGRHGTNFAAAWKFNTDGRSAPLIAGDAKADLFRYDAAYLFRVHPTTYTAETKGAWYAMLEANGTYETNGDHEVLLSPGAMYEGRRWVFEFSLQLPAVSELDHRPEEKVAVVFGLRVYL